MSSNNSRLQVVDALRGFAIVSIMLLHNLEHFDYYFLPENIPTWLKPIDQGIWDSMFFLFGGKSYAIFALLFGLTFFIQSNNQEKKGKDFRGRFAWRLVLLLIFGIINSAFYQGDILTIYALVGFFLIPVARLSNKAVFLIAVILMLQPYEWINFIIALQQPAGELPNPVSWSYFGKMGDYITNDSFFKTIAGNLTNGKIAVLNWTWENGRVFQTLSLFMLGMLAGRTSRFNVTKESKNFWVKTLVVSTLVFIPLYILKNNMEQLITNETIRRPLQVIETSWNNLAFMLVLVSSFVLLFQQKWMNKILTLFSPIGRMSLSNYILQSILGSFIYYGFGMGMYMYTGASYCLIIGLMLAILQGVFSKWWMKNHAQGPLESIWHKLTWLGSKK